MSASWGCPHEDKGTCGKVNQLPCDPGMKGCVLFGRFVFFADDKNERLRQKQARTSTIETTAGTSDQTTPPDPETECP